MGIMSFAVGFLWVIVLAQTAVIFALARQIGVLFERITPVGAMISDTGPEIGAPAPVLALRNLNGPDLTLGGAQDRSQLYFCLSPTGPNCTALIPVLRGAAREERDWLDIRLASDGKEAAHRALIASERLEAFPYVLSQELGMTFKVAKLPFAVLIDARGVIKAKGLVNNREQIESLFTASELNVPSLQSLIAAPSAG